MNLSPENRWLLEVCGIWSGLVQMPSWELHGPRCLWQIPISVQIVARQCPAPHSLRRDIMEAIKAVLEKHGIEDEQITAQGFGAYSMTRAIPIFERPKREPGAGVQSEARDGI